MGIRWVFRPELVAWTVHDLAASGFTQRLRGKSASALRLASQKSRGEYQHKGIRNRWLIVPQGKGDAWIGADNDESRVSNFLKGRWACRRVPDGLGRPARLV